VPVAGDGASAVPAASRVRHLRLRDVRSVWGSPVEVPLGAGVTVLVGPNRSGTSNVAWALTATLDPAQHFDPRRDLPRRRRGHARPTAEVRVEDGREGTVRWDPGDGRRSVTGVVPTGHVVWAPVDRLPRDLLTAAPLDLADPAVRDLLADEVQRVAEVVLPGIVAVTVDDRGDVRLRDDLGSSVPVPETRAIVAVALTRRLAAVGRPPAALVVEAPEVFLHPAGQETIADLLTAAAAVTGTPVIITTTSPFAVPRTASTTVVALARDAVGRTDVTATARGDAPQARLLGGLLRDTGLAAVLDRISLPPTTRGILIVEGGTDEAYLQQAAATLGRADALVDVVIRPAGGAMAAAAAAILLRAESEVPVVVLLDHDPAGRRALDTLVSRFDFDRQREALTYADVFEGGPLGVEAETLFDPQLLRRFVRERGPASSNGEQQLPQGLVHVDLTSSGKSAFVGWLRRHATPAHLERWGLVLDLLDDRFPAW
jgi:hypothetical protein